MLRRLAALSLAALTTACAGPSLGPRAALTRFPIGMYGVNDPKHLARLKVDGFDAFHTYATDPAFLASMAEEAKRQGMRMVIYADKLRDAPASRTSGWPVDAWYLFDEPDVVKLSSAALQSRSDMTRGWDPARPQTFVIGQGSPAPLYAGVGDIMMMDWYPVPHRPTDSVADQIDLVTRALPPGKPFWMVVQAYDWADEVTDPVKLKKGLRFPTRAEIRFMSYLSVLHGARGLFYFTLTKKGRTLFDYPELWSAVSGVAREIRQMQAVFERGERIRLPFPVPAFDLEAGAWRYRGRDYVVLLNRNPSRAAEVPAELLDGAWGALFSSERDPKALLGGVDGRHLLPAQGVVILTGPPG